LFGVAVALTAALAPGQDYALAQQHGRAVCVAALASDTKAGQVLLALVDNPADAQAELDDGTITGIAPFGTVSSDELAALASLLADQSAPFGVLVASDEEGGRVQRFRGVIAALPSASNQAATMTPDEVEALYTEYGTTLRGLGVTIAFAPVVDVGGGPAIGSRSYSDDQAVVAEYASAVIAGYRAAGILPVLKHFPGHGRASADTHDGAAVTPPLEDLRGIDLAPYVEIIANAKGENENGGENGTGGVAVMVGHLDVPGLTNGTPASMSPAAITGLLRDELGFSGLVISDALGMGAILQFATPAEAAVQFLIAGGDLAIINLADAADVHAAIVDAVASERLPQARLDEAAERVLQIKGIDATCRPLWKNFAIGLITGPLRQMSHPAQS
jgi:beta-N-acetylhexosaminidase